MELKGQLEKTTDIIGLRLEGLQKCTDFPLNTKERQNTVRKLLKIIITSMNSSSGVCCNVLECFEHCFVNGKADDLFLWSGNF